jgi:8-oxo-dGTP pyrophosphatase MutT (NUDIX family)
VSEASGTPKPKFNPRAAAVALHQGRVLLNRNEPDDFWSLPGGRLEAGESSADALRREMAEELDIDIEIGRMIWVVENFFDYENQPLGEIGFYYDVEFPESITKHATGEPFYGKEGALKIIFQWYRPEHLDDIDLRPGFLAKALQDIPSTTQHIIYSDPW